MNAQRLTIITAVIVLLAALGFFIYSRTQTKPTVATGDANQVIKLEGQPMIGDANAPVTVVGFEDFKCPACKNFEDAVYPQFNNDYIRTGKVKFYFINFAIPLGPDSVTAAIAGECAYHQNETAFWEYKTILYRSQEDERLQWATPAHLVELAKTYVPDLNSDDLKTCIDEERYKDLVQQERDMGVAAGVQGTPSLFVNGKLIENYSYPVLQNAIDNALNGN